MDDLVAQFMAVTSCEADTAQQYLNASDWNLEQAVELFFASGGATESVPEPSIHNNNDQVRETIASYDDQIIDDEAQLLNDYLRDTRRARARARPRNIFNQSRDTNLDELAMTKHEKRLAALFRPPFDIITDAPLDEARELALQQRKLIMVNVQDAGEFACQRLNRDLWRSERLKDLIFKNFIFLQYDVSDPDGEDYKGLYPFEGFPHIAILDPWTGERQKVWSKIPEESSFIEDVVDFVASVPEHIQEYESKSDDDNEESSSEKETGTNSNETKEPEPEPEPEKEPEPEPSPIAAIPQSDAPEPPMGPNTTRIQFRYGDGKRVVRRFLLSDPVSHVYGVAKYILSFDGSVTLTSERRDLESELGKTVEEANLKNSTVLVERN